MKTGKVWLPDNLYILGYASCARHHSCLRFSDIACVGHKLMEKIIIN